MKSTIIRAPQVVHRDGDELELCGIGLGKTPEILYRRQDGETIAMEPSDVEKSCRRPQPPAAPKSLVPQGKYECAAAALAILTGHTLFQVKRAMGMHGWRNDNSGANDYVLREAARSFGLDLIFGGKNTILALLDDMPDCMVSVRSLNYPKMGHGVAWYGGEIVDPNFGRTDRKFWGPEWAPWTMGAGNVLILTRKVLPDARHKEIESVRKHGTDAAVRDIILSEVA